MAYPQETFVFVLDNEALNDKAKMEDFSNLMAKIQDETVAYIGKLAVELGVSEGCANDFYYLRSRKRWTQELED